MEIEVLVNDWEGYRLLDSGNCRKLEQFGSVKIIRSEPKAWWSPALPESQWRDAVAVHEDSGREGHWRFLKRDAPKEWELPFRLKTANPSSKPAARANTELRFQLRFMDNSKQIGLFPEQSPHWHWISKNPPHFPTKKTNANANLDANPDPNADAPPTLLNLFGYTGAASLVAASAGWHVTHVDASKPAIAWGRRNAEISGIADAPIRWILEDAVKFVQREARRGKRYDAILLDPPAFGRGPGGELWKIERDLPPLLENCRALLSDRAQFVLLTVYTIDASSILCRNLLQQMTANLGGSIHIGELTHNDEAGKRLLPLSLWGRWQR